jgi:nucleoside-diphosphate-sugar epimerase
VADRVLVTGAAGRIGSWLRPRLARPGRVLRLLDTGPQDPPAPGEAVELVTADLTDPAAVATACDGADAVVHLGAIPVEDEWANLLRVNIDGTRTVLEGARDRGVPRVVLASSIHAVGFRSRADGEVAVPSTIPPRPDTYYGMSKAALEALGSLYADRFGMAVFALRIGVCVNRPPAREYLPVWLSPDDCARLVDACLATPQTGFHLIWGISRNRRRWWSLAEGERIGYAPRDDSEAYAGELAAGAPDQPTEGPIGRDFVTTPLGTPRQT